MIGESRFLAKYEATVARNDSLLCVGLDPDPALLPPGVDVMSFLRQIIEATSDLVACYKPNAAFFEALPGDPFAMLREVIAAVPPDVPVLLDAKRNDIGNSASFYAQAVFERIGADAVTVNGYLGRDGVQPFLDYHDRHTFVLVRTSNVGARDLQDLVIGNVGGPRLYEHMASLVNDWNEHHNLGMVVGATYPEEAARIRVIAPEPLILAPGVGAQEGDLEAAVRACLDASSRGLLVNASRGVTYASHGTDYAVAARAAAEALRNDINAARRAAATA
ncbi:MAG: orotidine-5'-phosphate decarboxylase [Dehalococcoidia bacterium]|nr:orotidine-5'-phosphate decarboxylase [Dehalococcoidia bacterium]